MAVYWSRCHLVATRVAALFFLTVVGVQGRTWRVPSECPTIHAGLDSASYGDTVLVAPGTYLRTDDPETWINPGPGICLTSETGPELTIVEFCNCTHGIGLGSFVSCEGARVSGFTIRFGSGPDCHSPPAPTMGIFCWNRTDVIVENCIIEDVSYGIYTDGSSSEWWKPVFRNNIIRNCTYGIACYDVVDPGRPFFQNNIVTECNCGGQIMDSSPNFEDNEITHCRNYGLFYMDNCGGNCDRNIIANNDNIGVYVYADPPLATPGFNGGLDLADANDFYGNGSYDIWYEHSSGTGLLMAVYNYWGSECPDFATKINGEVNHSLWVDSTHTVVFDEDDCPGATEASTWGRIKAMFR